VPIILYLFKIRDISIIYKYFFYHLVVGFINENIHNLIKIHLIGTISSLLYYLVETQCFLYLISKWSNISIIKYKLLSVILLGFWIVDCFNYLQPIEKPFKWMYLFSLFILIIISIKSLTKNDNNFVSEKLIIIPFNIYSIYFIILNLLMYFLYNKQTKQLFIILYSVINVINFLSYISYSLALLWAPKKEKYL